MNPLLAWRKDLDKDSSMRVNFNEFVVACGRLGRSGAVENPAVDLVSLYCALDQNRSGWFTLHDWDQQTFHLLLQFRHWAKNKCGKVVQFIRSLEDNSKTGINSQIFRQGTRDLSL